MTQEQINELNKKIGYTDGQIYFEINKGLTSKLMQNLQQKFGYKTTISGTIHYLKNDKGKIVCSGASWGELLYVTAIILR